MCQIQHNYFMLDFTSMPYKHAMQLYRHAMQKQGRKEGREEERAGRREDGKTGRKEQELAGYSGPNSLVQ